MHLYKQIFSNGYIRTLTYFFYSFFTFFQQGQQLLFTMEQPNDLPMDEDVEIQKTPPQVMAHSSSASHSEVETKQPQTPGCSFSLQGMNHTAKPPSGHYLIKEPSPEPKGCSLCCCCCKYWNAHRQEQHILRRNHYRTTNYLNSDGQDECDLRGNTLQ